MEKLRKFGLEYCDLSTMIWNSNVLLRTLTLNIDIRNKKKIPTIFYIINAIVAFSYFYVYLVSMIWFVFWKCRESGELIIAMVVFSLGISSEIGPCKLFYMFCYKQKINAIVGGYLACDKLTIRSSRFSKNLLTTLRYVKKRALIFWVVIITNGVIYIMKPIILPGRHLMEDQFILYGMDPIFESPNYEIAFFLMACGVICCCYLPANITAFLIVLIGYTEATMLALSEELVNLWSDAQQHYSDSHMEVNEATSSAIDHRNTILNKYVKQRLHEIVRIHTTNINLILQIEQVFRGAIALEFVLLITGLISELLGGLENTYIEMPFAFMQVAMDCLTGQRMMDACVKFEYSVYDCKWEHFDVDNMKIVLLMLQNAQKTMVLSAGGMTTLSFSCLMTVIRSIYSAYTTLRSTVELT